MKKRNLSAKKLVKLSGKEFHLYNKFEKKLFKIAKQKKLALAVSGGPDSLALSVLSKVFSVKYKIKLIALLIDHNLRKNSFKEITKVSNELKKFQIKTKILKIKSKITSNLHATARHMRYELMINFCKKNKIKYLLIGHQNDDVIENFYIRLSRGSGLFGLAPIEVIKKYKSIEFIRPLLDFKKKDLSKIASKNFNFILKDPSNSKDLYLRSRIRKLKNQLEKEGLNQDRINSTLANLASAKSAIEHFTRVAEKKYLLKNGKKMTINKKLFINEPYEIRFRVLSNLFLKLSKKDFPPRSKSINRLINLCNGKKISKMTLGGYIFANGHKNVIVFRENRV